jgi:hypothetical protein
MVQQKGTDTTKCQKCGYEFLFPVDDPCPKCGSKLKKYTVELPTATVILSGSLTRQQEQITDRKIINWPIKIILVIILIGSPILGLFLANIPGAIIGFLIDIVAWYLEKFAEQRFIEKTIVRDHYH